MPPEFCDYGPSASSCKDWLKNNHPMEYAKLYDPASLTDPTKGESTGIEKEMGEMSVEDDSDEKKRQTRGGKGMPREKKETKKEGAPKRVVITRKERGKRKFCTVVTGLTSCEIDVKKSAKAFGSKFACGSSVTGPDEIVIQGDFLYEMAEYLNEKMG
eukprot:Ihof_evm1s657 gene=Ihof_evmTU1s657